MKGRKLVFFYMLLSLYGVHIAFAGKPSDLPQGKKVTKKYMICV